MATDLRVWKGDSEQHIDQVNQWMRAQPWYSQILQQWGQDPAHPHELSDAQRSQLLQAAQANGVVVDQGNIEVDPGGNFNPIGHKLRNFLIGAGIAGGGLFGAAALGAGPLSGLFGGAASTAGGAGAAGAGAAGAAGAAGTGTAGAVAAGGAGTLGSTLLRYGLSAGIPAIAGLYGTHMANSANDQAAALQAQSAKDALDFAKQQEATRHAEFEQTQSQNKALWDAREANLTPYRNVGLGAMAQLSQPIPGSIGALISR